MGKSAFSDFPKGALSGWRFLFLFALFFSAAFLFNPDRSSAVQSRSPSFLKETSQDVYYKMDGVISGPPAPSVKTADYLYFVPLPSLGGNRVLIWIMAQQHLYLGGFTLGALLLVTLFECRGVLSGREETKEKYDRMAHEVLRAVLLALSLTAITGGVFLLGLLVFYPDLLRYLATVFRPFLLLYGFLFVLLSGTTALYEHAWRRMQAGSLKRAHLLIGIFANLLGLILLLIASSWSGFMQSPSGVDEAGRFLGNHWNVLDNPLWIAFSVHRFFGHLVLGAAVIAAYAAVKALYATTVEERGRYEWMGHVSFVVMTLALFTLPAGGYWMMRVLYGYRQQAGISLLGGLLAWAGILLVFAIGTVIIAINYYLWQRIDTTGEGRFSNQATFLLLILSICFTLYVTPHTLVMTPLELNLMGGAQHPVIGNYGVESAKQPAINIMLIVTIWSLLSFWRSRYQRSSSGAAEIALHSLFAAGVVNLITLGIYGSFIPANVRIGFQIPMIMTTLSIGLFGFLLTYAMMRKEKKIDRPIWPAFRERPLRPPLYRGHRHMDHRNWRI